MAVEDHTAGVGQTAGGEPSTATLVRQLTEQTSRLARQEARLAQLELQEKAKRISIGTGMFGGAGLLAAYGVGAGLAAIAAALTYVVPIWAAAVIVAGGLFLLAGLLALTGRASVRKGTPPTPQATVENVREDVQAVKEGARR